MCSAGMNAIKMFRNFILHFLCSLTLFTSNQFNSREIEKSLNRKINKTMNTKAVEQRYRSRCNTVCDEWVKGFEQMTDLWKQYYKLANSCSTLISRFDFTSDTQSRRTMKEKENQNENTSIQQWRKVHHVLWITRSLFFAIRYITSSFSDVSDKK